MQTSGYAQYREQSVLTAGPGELVLLLYDGCLKEVRMAKLALAEKQTVSVGNHLVKAQAFVDQLISGLNFDYELSRDLYALYEYLNHELMLANLDKDSDRMDAAMLLLEDLRDTWTEAVQQVRTSMPTAAIR